MNHEGNELADKCAKLRASLSALNPLTHVTENDL